METGFKFFKYHSINAALFAVVLISVLSTSIRADELPQPELVDEPPPPPETDEPANRDDGPEPDYVPPPPSDFGPSRSAPSKYQRGQKLGGASTEPSDEPEVDDSVIRVPAPVPVKPRAVSKKETAAACKKHEGRYISYYSELFLVQKCRRRLVQDHDEVLKLVQAGKNISEVESDIIAALPKGAPLVPNSGKKVRSCKQLEGRFVTFSYVDVYLVEKCHKRLFPDWETFTAWQKKAARKKARIGEIIDLSEIEFEQLRSGPDIPSLIDAEFSKQFKQDKVIDLIPIDEACRGVEGKIVTFYSKVYRIEKCRKREMDPEFASQKYPGMTPRQLSPEQWNSLPDGKPVTKPGATQPAKEYRPQPHRA